MCVTEFIVHANNLVFLAMYRELVIQYGLWDQLRVDQGKEWVLMLFMQEQLAHLRTNTSHAPHTPADYIKDGKFILILKIGVYSTVIHVLFLFNRTTALRGCGLKSMYE